MSSAKLDSLKIPSILDNYNLHLRNCIDMFYTPIGPAPSPQNKHLHPYPKHEAITLFSPNGYRLCVRLRYNDGKRLKVV